MRRGGGWRLRKSKRRKEEKEQEKKGRETEGGGEARDVLQAQLPDFHMWDMGSELRSTC